jgi:hypothetical protein
MAIENDDESPTTGIFVLRLHLGSPEPPRGTISALGATVTQPFYGWIELMSAINTLRGWENLEPGERLLPEAPFYSSGTEHRPGSDSIFGP